MIFFTIAILSLSFEITYSEDNWAIVGNPLLFVHPCNDTDDISISYEPGRSPELENSYSLFIEKQLPINTKIILRFDSEASVTLTNNAFARISIKDNDDFEIKFFRGNKGITVEVKGLQERVIPYLTYVEINTVLFCQNSTVGYLDGYIEGNKDYAETHRNKEDMTCGRRKIIYTELIVNGLSTRAGEWPWHVAIYRFSHNELRYICGGTLLSKNFVLTAAHCVTIRGEPVVPEILSVVLGKYNLIGGDTESQEREVYSIKVHEQFAYKYLMNDIALLKMKSEVQYNDYIQPACLWHKTAYEKLPTSRVYGTVVGWGFDHTDQLSPQLKKATMPKISENSCIKKNPLFYANVLNDRKFCAGLDNGTSACNGDSGGGFLVFVPDTAKDESSNAAGAWYVRGIVSMSIAKRDEPVCDPTQYVVFTDVAKYAGWIKNHIAGI